MKAIGYIRVSTDEQEKSGLGLESQKAKIESYCQLYDIELIEIVTDAASGKNINRSGLDSVLNSLETGKAAGVVIAKLDRLTRSVRDMGYLLEKYFQKYSLSCVVEQINTSTAAGRMMINILMSVAQWERETICERTKDALKAKKARGEKCGGHTPFGYEVDENGKLIPMPKEQEAIKALIRLKDKGYSYDRIAKKLIEDKVMTKTGGTWTAATVRQIYLREVVNG